jgi:hypothetical protein
MKSEELKKLIDAIDSAGYELKEFNPSDLVKADLEFVITPKKKD